MTHAVIIEPDPMLRGLVRLRMGPLQDAVHVTADVAAARLVLLASGEPTRVVARMPADCASLAALRAALPRAPVLPEWRVIAIDPGSQRVPDARVASAYLMKLDRLLASDWLARDSCRPPGPWDQYDHIQRLANEGGLQRHLVRDRVSGEARLLVQGIEGAPALERVYRRHARCARPWVDLLRHEIHRGRGYFVTPLPPPEAAGSGTTAKVA